MSRRSLISSIVLAVFVSFGCPQARSEINDAQTDELIEILDQIFDDGAGSLSEEQLNRLEELLALIDPDVVGPTLRTLRQQIIDVLGNPLGLPMDLVIPVKDNIVPVSINQGMQMPPMMMPPRDCNDGFCCDGFCYDPA